MPDGWNFPSVSHTYQPLSHAFLLNLYYHQHLRVSSFYVMPKNILRKVSRVFQTNSVNSDIQHTQDIPSNTLTNPSTPPVPLPPSSTEIPKNILAFRTITLLLSKIQQERAFQYSQPTLTPPERKELKLSNAFSTIAVIHDEIVAVVSKRTPDRTIEVIASAQSSEPINVDPLITPSPTGLVSQVWNFLVTQNYRWGGLVTRPFIAPPREPTFSNANHQTDLNFDDDVKLKLYVDEYW